VKTRYLAALSLFVLALALASCGGSSKTVAEKPAIRFSSPALAGRRVIPASYKCDTRFVWLPLKWGALPTHTQELALYMIRFGAPKVTTGGSVNAPVEAEALVVGLQPTLGGLRPGKYPPGALIAVHAPGGHVQSICPPKGSAQDLLFRIYALRHKLDINKGSQTSNLLGTVNKEALEAGTFIAGYRPA
jgi:phosphatidylethanolamine-binding protein (PEBP) family uncharacterized protein